MGEGVSTDKAKIEAMINWPLPVSIKGLCGFLGLTGYYRLFIQNYAVISKPLTTLLKKEGFLWTKEATLAFETLKYAMTHAPVLALPDFKIPFTVEVDASGLGVGAVLSQNNKPIAFMSQALSPKHLGLSTYEKELIALLLAVEKWRHYLQPHHFVIKTDHFSLKFLRDQRITASLQHKGVTKLLGLSYEMHYRQGKENVVADALSRRSEEAKEVDVGADYFGLCVSLPKWVQEIVESYEGDQEAQDLITKLSLDPKAEEVTLQSGLLRFKGKVWVGTWNTKKS